MFENLREKAIEWGLTDDERTRINHALKNLNSAGYDPWGVSPDALATSLIPALWFYKNYFRVETEGLENIPPGRVMLVANHGGQVPIDGTLIATAVLTQGNPPRVVRGMVERWAPSLPFVSTFFARTGQLTGDIRNARDILEHEEALMVFPEGVSGSGKSIFERYKLQKFGNGFMRLALDMHCPIVPVSVVGTEESLPSLTALKPLAKKLGIPYLPLIPTGIIPLPTKVFIRFGTPIYPKCETQDPSATELEPLVAEVKRSIKTAINETLRRRGEKIFTGGNAAKRTRIDTGRGQE